MGYDMVSVTSVAGDPHWRVVVNKTFLDVVSEKGPPVLTHVSSAPGHLETCSSVPSDSSSVVERSDLGERHATIPGMPDESSSLDPSEILVGASSDVASDQLIEIRELHALGCGNQHNSQLESEPLPTGHNHGGPRFPPQTSGDELEQEACKDELTQLRKTAKRNKRRRAQALAAKNADPASLSEIDNIGVVTNKKSPTPPSMEKAATTVSSPSTQVWASILKGAKSKNRKKKGEFDGLDTASTASTASTETLWKDDLLAVSTWRGENPTAEQRVALRSQFFKICCEQTRSELLEERSNKLFPPEELAKFDCTSDRPLVSVYGDIFDVSSSPEKYGPNGIRHFQAGTDITWALLSGYHTKEASDQFYDIFKQTDEALFASHLMHLCSTIVQFQQEYGAPIGRHSMFANERDLPAPPMDNRVDCVVQ